MKMFAGVHWCCACFFWFSGMFWGSISEEKWRSPIFRENPHFSKIGQKGPKIAQKWGFWDLWEKFCISFVWKWLKTKEQIKFELLQKTACQKTFFGQDMAENGHFCGARKFFFPKKNFFFRKFFFCSIFKINSFWAKKWKKKISSQIPL